MNGLVTSIRSRLGIRLLIFLLAGVVLSFGILTYLIVRRESALLMDFNRRESSVLADTITSNLREAMLEKDPAIVKRMLGRHNSTEDIKAAVFRSDGSLAYGDMKYEMPRDMIVSPREMAVKGEGSLVFLKPLFNEKECHSCHGAKDHTRGIVAIRISTAKAEGETRDTAKRIAVFASLTALLSGLGLTLVIRKMVSGPLKMLKAGTDKIRDGDLDYRLSIQREDELGSLASSFNRMAETVEGARRNLEDAVHRKTKELRVVAGLSTEVFRSDLDLKERLDKFLSAITEDLGYSFCSICFIDRETGLLSQEYSNDARLFCASDIALTEDHPFVKALLTAKTRIIRSQDLILSDMEGHVALVPVVSRMRHCWEVNWCTYAGCPAYHNHEGHCWLMEHTLCRSPHSVKGKAKIYGCMFCNAFPLIGILIAGREEEIGKSSIHSLEIMSAEIATSVENYRLIEEKKKDIRDLLTLHDVSVRSTQHLTMPELTSSIVTSAVSFSGADAAILWLVTDGGDLRYEASFGVAAGLVPSSIRCEGTFIGRSVREERPIETVAAVEIQCLGDLIRKENFLYAASIPLHGQEAPMGCLTLLKKDDFLMSDSEKVIIALYASQAASSLALARTYGDLKNEKELADAIFNSTLSGVAVLDREGAVINVNRAGMEILKLSDNDIAGRRITEIYPETEGMLHATGDMGKDLKVKMADGTARPVGFTNAPLFDKNGDEKGLVIVFRDLTEIKELEAELRKKQHFESMGKVISGVAHEVRNPLFAIQSVAQILEREIKDEKQRTLLLALLKETGRMKNLIDELLLYGRDTKLNIVDLDLKALFEELAGYCAAKDRGADLMIEVPSFTNVMGDKDKLTQVFLNILDNALGAGGKTIRVASETTNGTVRVSVRDDGAGIKSDDIERIFDPFFTTKKEGTGLGLPICRKVIEDHGGSIQVRSDEGKGTTVILTLKKNPLD